MVRRSVYVYVQVLFSHAAESMGTSEGILRCLATPAVAPAVNTLNGVLHFTTLVPIGVSS